MKKQSFKTPSRRRIVICGSLTFYDDILNVQRELNSLGLSTEIPAPVRGDFDNEPEVRRREAYLYLKKIRDPRTLGILAVNPRKHNIENYIGPSTFSEISVAFAASKRIFVLNKFPDSFLDELREWRAVALDGNIEGIINFTQGDLVETTQQELF